METEQRTTTHELNDHSNTNPPDNPPEISSNSYHALDNSDTGSCSSESPLIPVRSSDIKDSADHVTMDFENHTEVGLTPVNESSNLADACSTDEDHTLLNIQETKEGHIFGSGVSVASILRDAEVIKATPIHVFGSGWEFGSICSINLHGAGDVARSRANTMDQHISRYPTSPGQDRLLSRIFKDKIGSIRLDKGSEKEVSVSFINDSGNATIDAMSHNRSKHLKNLLILSASITFLHIAVFGLRNLQSSLNSEDGLGVYSLATLCGAFMVASLVSPFIVQRYGPNKCLSVACCGLLIYVIANYFPNFYTIMPASVVHGVCNALLWNAVCTYITELGIDEAYLKGKVSSNVLSRYFGMFFLMLQLSMVLGNLISSVILSQSANRISNSGNKYQLADTHISTTIAYTFNINETQLVRVPCGVAHCDINQGSTDKPYVDDLDKLFLLGTYSSCAIIAILVIQCCLDQLPNYTPTSPSFKEAVKQAGSVLAMVVDRRFCFIVMLCMYTVISNGFVVADVLKVWFKYLLFLIS